MMIGLFLSFSFFYHSFTIFYRRHQDLILAVKKALKFNERRFQEFRDFCLSFRQGIISGHDFYENFVTLFKDSATKLFPMLIELLPDARKRSELLAASHDKKMMVTTDSVYTFKWAITNSFIYLDFFRFRDKRETWNPVKNLQSKESPLGY